MEASGVLLIIFLIFAISASPPPVFLQCHVIRDCKTCINVNYCAFGVDFDGKGICHAVGEEVEHEIAFTQGSCPQEQPLDEQLLDVVDSDRNRRHGVLKGDKEAERKELKWPFARVPLKASPSNPPPAPPTFWTNTITTPPRTQSPTIQSSVTWYTPQQQHEQQTQSPPPPSFSPLTITILPTMLQLTVTPSHTSSIPRHQSNSGVIGSSNCYESMQDKLVRSICRTNHYLRQTAMNENVALTFTYGVEDMQCEKRVLQRSLCKNKA